MHRAAVVVSIAAAACTAGESVSQFGANTLVETHGGYGGEVSAIGAIHGVGGGIALWGRQVMRPIDPNHHLALGLDGFLRVSVLGIFISGRDHRLEHWFDLGGAAGVGAGGAHPASISGESHAWVGAWAHFGLWSTEGHPALEIGIRQMSESAPWNDEVVYTIGLAWTTRTYDPNITWHD